MKHFLSILMIVFCGVFVHGQQIINGVLLNQETKEPIPYASIMISNTFKGVSTSEKGTFLIEEFDLTGNEKLIVQRLGYYSDTLLVKDLWESATIYLQAKESSIDEIVIRPVDAFEIVQAALEKVPENYYHSPIAQTAFYRQTMVGNNELIGLEEGHFDIINTFNKKSLPQNITVHKARGFVDFSMVEDLGKLIANNIEDDSNYVAENAEMLLGFNPNFERLTDDEKHFFGEKGEKRYEYLYNGLVEMDGRIAHHITFDQKEDLKKTLFRGSMYIDTASLAVIDINVELSPQGVDFQKLLPLRFRLAAKLLGFTIEIDDLSFHAHYSLYDENWVFSQGNSSLKAKISKRNGVSIEGYALNEFFVLNNREKAAFYNLPSNYDVIPSKIEDFEQTDFWQGLNFPLPTKTQNLLNEKLINDE